MQQNQQLSTLQYRFFTDVKEVRTAITESEIILDENFETKYEDVDMVQLITIGDKNYMPIHEVKEYQKLQKRMQLNELMTVEQIQSFNNQYKMFKEGKEFTHEGTPLSAISLFSKADVLNLNNQNIFTVEQLASIADGLLHTLGHGINTLKQKAITYLESKKDNDKINKVIEQNEILFNKHSQDQATIAELQAQLANVQHMLATQNQEPKAKSK